jgi:Vacuolar protein 14 C-terminal Fig4p binding
VYKSLEVLARITVPVPGEEPLRQKSTKALPGLGSPLWTASGCTDSEEMEFPMNDSSVEYAMKTLDQSRRRLKSRDREVFSALIQLHADNEELLADLSNVITYMCKLQPPEFVMVSFAVEVHRFVKRNAHCRPDDQSDTSQPRDLRFVSSFIQHMNHVLLNTDEARELRDALKDCIASKGNTEVHRQRSRLFHILLHSFSHNIAATLSLCLWAGACRTAFLLLSRIDPLDINLIFLLEIDRLVELLERPLFR